MRSTEFGAVVVAASLLALAATAGGGSASKWLTSPAPATRLSRVEIISPCRRQRIEFGRRIRTYSSSSASMMPSLKLTPALEEEVVRLKMAPDNALRHQQLLFYAKEADPLPSQYKKTDNKVPGCLSTVWVVAKQAEDGKVYFRGDSDALITKGLVNLLVRGLSGYSAEEIIAVDPSFIKEAGITQSLTPGRNNGFLNMLKTMKKKAAKAANLVKPQK